MIGFIKTHRKIIEWEWYRDANTYRLFMHLLYKATYKPARYMGCDLQPGDVVYGHPAFAQQLGLSVQNVRTSLNKLKSTGEVTVRSMSKFSIVSVVKWSEYQTDQQPDQQATNRRLTGDQQATNNIQEVKKERSKEGGARGTRFSPQDRLPDEWADYAKQQGLADPQKEYERFSDYWVSKSGQQATKTDWLAVWRNWVRRSLEYNPEQKRNERRGPKW